MPSTLVVTGVGNTRASFTTMTPDNGFNISSPTVVKLGASRIVRVSVLSAGSSVGGVYDQATVTGYTVATQVAVIPNVVGITFIDWPCTNGILIIPGTGQVVAVSHM